LDKSRIKVGYFISHPIQYQVPLQCFLASSGLDFKVFYFSDQSVRSGSVDREFGCQVKWDVSLLDNYPYEFLSRRPNDEFKHFSIPDPEAFFQREQLDVAMVHGYAGGFVPQLIRWKKRFHYKMLLRGEFTEWRETPPNPLKHLCRFVYLHWLYPQIDAFGAIGECAKEHLRHFRVPENKIFFAPYSVDDAMFERQKQELDREECRKSLNIQPDEMVFLFSGKLIPRKRALLLARAFCRCASSFRAKIIFLGSGEQEQELHRLLGEALADRCILPGFVNQSQLGRYFRAADVFVLPSSFDAWGLVVNEAMHFGLPAIVSDNCCCGVDLIKEGQTGYRFAVDDLDALTDCLRKCLENPSQVREMGRNAAGLIQNYTIRKTGEGILSAIKHIMELKQP